jgi:hypothetical protein
MATTGVPSIIKLTRRICYYVGRYGAGGLATATTPEFATALFALVEACNAFTSLDDYPAEIDRTVGYGPEDLPPA